jgi:hypothetical protein
VVYVIFGGKTRYPTYTLSAFQWEQLVYPYLSIGGYVCVLSAVFDFERTEWKLFQKRALNLIPTFLSPSRYLCRWTVYGASYYLAFLFVAHINEVNPGPRMPSYHVPITINMLITYGESRWYSNGEINLIKKPSWKTTDDHKHEVKVKWYMSGWLVPIMINMLITYGETRWYSNGEIDLMKKPL